MIIYGSTMSPFVRKALAFAAEAGLAFDYQQAAAVTLYIVQENLLPACWQQVFCSK